MHTVPDMTIKEPVRIISDLHLGHSSCSFENPAALAPLFRGVASVIFNGDSVETNIVARRKEGARNAEALQQECLKAGAQPWLINGNHDPEISGMDHADLADGAVLVTHGDLLFHDISPWSKRSIMMGRAHTEQLEALGEDAFHDFEKRLHASKRAVLAVEMHDVPLLPGPLAKVMFVLEEFWPPWRPLQIIKCWIETPGRAVALARTFRPRARFVIIGHTHRAGIWRIGPRIIINTGSYMPFGRPHVIDIAGNKLSVKTVVRKGSQFGIGKEVARFDISKLAPGEGD